MIMTAAWEWRDSRIGLSLQTTLYPHSHTMRFSLRRHKTVWMNDYTEKDCASVKMDESALLDLLECPVCLERLDATAKVLPCQHTFCRRCLLGIVGSRGELRCPECRTLVESGVDELPSNILLVRLLDGIKQRPRRTGSMHGTCTNGSAAAVVRAQGAGGGQRDPGPTGAQSQRVQAKSTPVRVSLDVFFGLAQSHTSSDRSDTIQLVFTCRKTWMNFD